MKDNSTSAKQKADSFTTRVDCIGVDGMIHTFESHKTVTTCGVKIRRKKLLPRDLTMHFSCYECTY